ncbi:hypothetical protein DFJ73DRAFT_777425 [Zopfochytrium polystomum]|nr:hypothetical protein DFJ73DRAFT_777425 [Zopfochytrium polystomum]
MMDASRRRRLLQQLVVTAAAAAASFSSLSAAGVTHTAADCQFANQFLCKVQCGKVLIQCTGAGTGAELQPLDEDAAVCNNGQIDFAQTCVTTGGAGTGGAGTGASTTTTTTTAVGAGKGGVATVTTTSSAATPPGTGTEGARGLTLTGFPAIAVGTACTSGYACGGRNVAGEDSIVSCTGGAYVKLDDCNDAPNVACSLINGQPFCVKP